MFLARMAYYSRPVWDSRSPEARRKMLKGILSAGIHNNPQAGLTGALVFDGIHFIQILEGMRSRVWATFKRIESDPRHCDVVLAGFLEVPERLFPNFAVMAPADGATFKHRVAIPDPDVATFDMLVAYAARHFREQKDLRLVSSKRKEPAA
ncbi:BLUF domain-containing protein [Maricaulis sp.]|uniref:BLUF domain-containing protein n=1 Tax=Maricaulis sp. TaxID=1486257 RepID=UPI00260BE5D5|nr:BLUF domain-containing protein [Maricaulis sp.]